MHFDKTGTFLTIEEFKKVKDSFELKNEKKIQSMRMQLWGRKKMPDKIKHWKKVPDKDLVSIPAWLRGFWNFTDKYIEEEKILHPEINNPFKWNELDLTQNKKVSELLEKNIWLLHASTGVWKTMMTAKIISKLGLKTLIVVSWIELMNQMKGDLREILWVTYKTLSGLKTKQKLASEDIIIANIDTLVKQDQEFFNQFDVTILDEVDTYLSADRRRECVWQNITSKYIYGLTWTIKLNCSKDKIFDIYFWPKTELLEKHFSPKIYKVLSEFEYSLDDIKKFHELKAALYESEERNNLIVRTVRQTLWKKKGILFSEYIEHAKILKEMVEANGIKCFLLIWEIKDKERLEIKRQIKEYKWPCLLIGSVKIIWRGFNIPELSIWYLTTCEKFTSNIEQYVWRIIRKFPTKTVALWYDFVDPWCKTLYNQSKVRTRTYKKEFPESSIEFYVHTKQDTLWNI